MASPYPKPTALKLVEGNPGKRPLPACEPKPDVLLPRQAARLCPSNLQGEERRCWREDFRRLASCGLLTVLDLDALEISAVVKARRRAYEELLKKSVPIFRYPKTVKAGEDKDGNPIMKETVWFQPNPLCALVSSAEEMELKLLREFGKTPSARARVSTIGQSGADAIEEALA